MTSLRIAVVGAGTAGLAAAALLSPRHRVTVFERPSADLCALRASAVNESSRAIVRLDLRKARTLTPALH